MTLNATLALHGYTTSPAGNGQKHIIDSDGCIVLTGRAHDVWAWLAVSEINLR